MPQRPDISRQAASQAKETKFFGGDCKRKHGGLRYTKTGNCVECMQFHRDKKISQEIENEHRR